MKNYAMISAGVLASAAVLGAAQAQVAYTDSALNGCYAHHSTSVDTGSAAENKDAVGTMCFDGKGHIVAASHAPFLSGGVSNTNGVVRSHNDVTGRYSVTNSPGDGMGTFEGRCTKHAFVLRNVDSNGLAHGFAYTLMRRKKGCADNGPMVIGGGAEYQGPLK
jgi:hypothetical protein